MEIKQENMNNWRMSQYNVPHTTFKILEVRYEESSGFFYAHARDPHDAVSAVAQRWDTSKHLYQQGAATAASTSLSIDGLL